jgi:hypothetical protein
MSLSDSSSHGAGGFRTFRQTSRDRKSLVRLFLLLLLLLAQQQQQQQAGFHQCTTTNAENARWNHLGRKEGRRRTLPSLPPSLQLLLEEEHKETLTIIATVIFGLV